MSGAVAVGDLIYSIGGKKVMYGFDTDGQMIVEREVPELLDGAAGYVPCLSH